MTHTQTKGQHCVQSPAGTSDVADLRQWEAVGFT